jgi:NAD(P)-dependent dehydrogenase (short-subunit alcohol dehydrogenase family)
VNVARWFNLKGRVALVTGGSRGIGAAIGAALAECGAAVAVTSRHPGGCEATLQRIRDAGGRASGHVCHIGDLAAIEGLFVEVMATYGRLDVLVNNAGTNPSFGSVLALDAAAFAKTTEVNFRGTWFMSQHAARMMARTGSGSIINIASVTAERPMDGLGLYGATKAGIVGMTQAFARECAVSGVRVNAILPGLVNTKLAAALQSDAEVRARAIARIPLGRIAEPEDIVGAALYFASDASRYTTGALLRVDGGLNV